MKKRTLIPFTLAILATLIFLILVSFPNVAKAEVAQFGNWGGLYNSYCGPTASTYGDYHGYGPGNYATGPNQYISYGSGQPYTASDGSTARCPDALFYSTARMINIGTPIPLADIYQIDMISDGDNYSSMRYFVSQDGGTWHLLGTGADNAYRYFDRSSFAHFPITHVKYLRTESTGSHTDYFHAWIHYNANQAPNIPYIDNVASGQALNHDNPSFCWNFIDVNPGDYQSAFQLVGTTTGWASWQYDSGIVESGNRCFTLPHLGEGNWHFALKLRDSKGAWSPDWGGIQDIKLDLTRPTYTGFTSIGRQLNSTTFRVEVFGVNDNLSGINRVQFPTWTTIGGHDDLIWYDGVNAGGGHWYVDVPLSNHGNADGEYMTHIYVYDNAGHSVTPVVNTYIDRIAPTAVSTNTSGRWLNSTTFRLEVYGVSDNSSGVDRVMFPTWTEYNGQDDLQSPWHTHADYQGINAGGGMWYIDIPINKHNNEEGKYITHIYGWDKAGNQGLLGMVDTNVDRTKPTHVSESITGATYVSGNDYWVKPGNTIITKVRAKDDASGMKGIIHVFTGTNSTPGHSWIYYDTLDNGHDGGISGDVDAFAFNNYTETYDDRKEAETALSLTVKPTTSVKFYNFRYSIGDVATNAVADTNTGKRLIVDGQSPTGTITPNNSVITNQNITLTATGNDGTGSGMKRIKLPNNSYVNGSSATYTVSSNDTYTFEFEDNVGNITIQTITISNIDKTAPSIAFTPEEREADFKDIEVEIAIVDSGVAGFKDFRFAWSKEEAKPTEGWSDWDGTSHPIITQSDPGKWFLHIEALDNAGNVGYAFSGLYEKILPSGGPSVNVNVFPLPTGEWVNKPIDVYVMDSGDSELLSKAKKYYRISNSPLYPTDFNEVIPLDKKVQLNLQGENFIHVQYILDDGTKMAATSGPYLIDTGAIGDFEMKLVNASGIEMTTWSNVPLKLMISDPTTTSVSGIKKQYRVEGVHTDWQPYADGTTISVEGNYRVFGRIINETTSASSQQWVQAMIDKSVPKVSRLMLQSNANGTYDVTVHATDELSAVQAVKLDNGINVSGKNGVFTLTSLSTKPTSITVSDQAGNYTLPIAFAVEPVIAFENDYELTSPFYRGEIRATISNTTSYIIGWKKHSCVSDDCELIITKNTSVALLNEEGVKETKKMIAINNIDNSALSFVLNGKRNVTNPNKLEFEWNYPLTSGEMVCTENGVITTHPVTGKTHTFVGKNTLYECFVEGVYGVEQVKSNQVIVFADVNFASDGESLIEELPKALNVHIDETPTGNSYMINAKSDNYKLETFPFPKEVF